ncbi:MAG: efflux RND transporter periplasmic adaptor subunit [Bacteroidota bacterium]|nr:efflux RND transporter periplasmic adaptor subunit [Bacteroidota bacterium]
MKNSRNTMKNISLFAISILIISLVASCGGGKTTLDQKKESLDSLVKIQKKVADDISKIQKEIAELDTTNKDDKSRLISITKLENIEFKHYLEIQGRVDADENVTITAKAPGTITAVYVKVGDMVSRGQVLAQLDDQNLRSGMAELNNRLELATTVFQRQKNLWDQKIGSEIAFLQAKNNKEALEKSKATLNENLESFKIKSLVTGVLDEVFAKVGQLASPGFPAFRVVNNSKLKVKADVAETYSGKIKQGNNVLIVFPDINKETQSTVSYSGKVINPMSRTFNVECTLSGDMASYQPNMVAIVKIIDYENPKTLVIPINTIQNNEEGSYVFVLVHEGKKTIARKRIVTVGMNYSGKIEVKSGLQPGDELITTGYQDLNDGEEVKL